VHAAVLVPRLLIGDPAEDEARVPADGRGRDRDPGRRRAASWPTRTTSTCPPSRNSKGCGSVGDAVPVAIQPQRPRPRAPQAAVGLLIRHRVPAVKTPVLTAHVSQVESSCVATPRGSTSHERCGPSRETGAPFRTHVRFGDSGFLLVSCVRSPRRRTFKTSHSDLKQQARALRGSAPSTTMVGEACSGPSLRTNHAISSSASQPVRPSIST
jgi:hypothetical protein